MALIPNASTVAKKSWAVWVGYAAAGLLGIVGFLNVAPDVITAHLNVKAINAVLTWIAGGLAGPGVQVARVLQQNLFPGDTQ